MARTEAVWGIDIGNCSLKALRCRPGDQPGQLVAEAFDFIEYPKFLNQPGSDPAELLHEALTQFLSRNNVRGTRVAISVPGQSGLARFIRLPPIETKKIPDIVRYEARQQIPFDLNDVIWDYQRMGGGMEEEGFALETEIGLFAIKRDQVLRALEPFNRVGIPVDLVQLTPLALYNFVYFDQLRDLPPPEEFDPDAPPPSTVVLSMGTDTSDLVITNGFRVWQRSIPVGGSHFTKALVKELKLTFAKAEHLKRNAQTAQDPKAVFQAMRSVFGDLLSEVQRSIAYFSSIDRAARIERALALGNAMKLPGLRRYLSQSLGFEVDRLDRFTGLTGSEVISAPAFVENQLSFAVAYGLVIQGLKRGPVSTNLLPKEILKDRLVRAKKPWAVGAAAVLLLGCAISLASHAAVKKTVDENRFAGAERQATAVKSEADNYKKEADEALNQYKATDQIGMNVVQNIEGRVRWLELLRAISDALPTDIKGPGAPADPAKAKPAEKEESKTPEQWAEEISRRNQLYIQSLECVQVDKDFVKNWLQAVYNSNWIQLTPEEIAAAGITPRSAGDTAGTAGATAGGSTGGTMAGAALGAGLSSAAGTAAAGGTSGDSATSASAATTASGGSSASPAGAEASGGIWLVQLRGYHLHNSQRAGVNQGAEYVRNNFIQRLRDGKTLVPNGGPQPEYVPNKELAIKYPALINPGRIYDTYLTLPEATVGTTGAMGMMSPGAASMPAPGMLSGPSMPTPGMPGMAGTPGTPDMPGTMPGMPGTMARPYSGPTAAGQLPANVVPVRRFDFIVQFVWEPISPSQRKQRQLGTPVPEAGATEGAPAALGAVPEAAQAAPAAGTAPTEAVANPPATGAPGGTAPPVPAAAAPPVPGGTVSSGTAAAPAAAAPQP